MKHINLSLLFNSVLVWLSHTTLKSFKSGLTCSSSRTYEIICSILPNSAVMRMSLSQQLGEPNSEWHGQLSSIGIGLRNRMDYGDKLDAGIITV